MTTWVLILFLYPYGIISVPGIDTSDNCDALGVTIESTMSIITKQHSCLSYTTAVAPTLTPTPAPSTVP